MYLPLDSQWLALGIFLKWNDQGLCWLVIKMMPKLKWNLAFGKRTASSLCPGDRRLDVLYLLRTSCPIGDNVYAFHIDWSNLKLFFFWNKVKIWLASPPIWPQVCRGDKEKPLVFLNAISTPFKMTHREYLHPASCLFVVIIHIIRTGNLP